MSSIEDRLNRLEGQQSFLELHLEEMSQSLLDQQNRLTDLTRALERLTKQWATINHEAPITGDPELPPHY